MTHSSSSSSSHGFTVTLSISVSVSVFKVALGLTVTNELTNLIANTFEVGQKVSVEQSFPAGAHAVPQHSSTYSGHFEVRSHCQ